MVKVKRKMVANEITGVEHIRKSQSLTLQIKVTGMQNFLIIFLTDEI